MPDDIHIFKVAEANPFHSVEDVQRFEQAGLTRIRQVGLGEVAGDDALELWPRRVTNIFICSVVVFWASSMMMKASDKVRPRMKASGATSITLLSSILSDLDRIEQVVKRVIQRTQVRVHLLLQRSRQEAEDARRPRPPDEQG